MDDAIADPFDIVLPNYGEEGTLKSTSDRATGGDAEPPTSNFFEEAMRDTMSSYENFMVPYNTTIPSEEDVYDDDSPITNIAHTYTRPDGLATGTSDGPQGILGNEDTSFLGSIPPKQPNLDILKASDASNIHSNNADVTVSDLQNVSPVIETAAVETPASSPFAASSDLSTSVGVARSSFSSDADCCNGRPIIGSGPGCLATPRPKVDIEGNDNPAAYVAEESMSAVIENIKETPCISSPSMKAPAERTKKMKAPQAKLPNRTRMPHWKARPLETVPDMDVRQFRRPSMRSRKLLTYL